MLKWFKHSAPRHACVYGMPLGPCGQRRPVSVRLRKHVMEVLCMSKPWRPTIDDVDSISRGGRAKVRGTGSRRIPHRLNAEERNLYDLAKKKCFLAVRGTAYRKFRHGNPLPNIYRQWCDARGQVCLVVEQDLVGNRGTDRVVVDLAPLRQHDTAQTERLLWELAVESGLRRVDYTERPADALPFNILPPDEGSEVEAEEEEEVEVEEVLEAGPLGMKSDRSSAVATVTAVGTLEAAAAANVSYDGRSGAGGRGRKGSSNTISSSSSYGSGDQRVDGGSGEAAAHVVREESTAVLELQRAVTSQAEAVRQLKSQGLGNKDRAVQDQVHVLQQLKADLAKAEAALAAPPPPQPPRRVSELGPGSPDERAEGERPTADAPAPPPRSPLEHYYRLPIWQIHAVPMFFEGNRAAAKQFASLAVQRVAESARKANTTSGSVAVETQAVGAATAVGLC